jgi:hypothetical protein
MGGPGGELRAQAKGARESVDKRGNNGEGESGKEGGRDKCGVGWECGKDAVCMSPACVASVGTTRLILPHVLRKTRFSLLSLHMFTQLNNAGPSSCMLRLLYQPSAPFSFAPTSLLSYALVVAIALVVVVAIFIAIVFALVIAFTLVIATAFALVIGLVATVDFIITVLAIAVPCPPPPL